MCIEKLRHEYEVEILWTAFPLHPDTPEEGLVLEKLYAGRQVDWQERMTFFAKVAAELGLPFSFRQKTYNSRLAQELGKWAESQGKGDEFHNAVLRAYFVDCQNIAKTLVLLDIAESVGLSREEAQRVLETRAFKDVVDLEWSLAKAKGVTEVPTFLMNQWAMIGFQPYPIFEEFLKYNEVRRRVS